MKATLLCTLLFCTSINPYHEKMKATIQEMNQCVTMDDFKKVSNAFERISKMEPTEWLPLYYAAHIQIMLVYIDSAAAITEKDRYLDYAESLIAKMEKMDTREAEIYVLKAWAVLSRMGLDPQSRGQAMYQGYADAITRAAMLQPENPRVRYMQLAKEIGQAEFFGKDSAGFCPELRKLDESWNSYQSPSEIHPSWGRSQVRDLMKSCR